jgi:membrane protease YdiL (CAAX protease family)
MKKEDKYFLWVASAAFLILLFMLSNSAYFLSEILFQIFKSQREDLYRLFLNSIVVFCASFAVFLYFSFLKKEIVLKDLGLENFWQKFKKAFYYFLIFLLASGIFFKIYSFFVDLKALYAVEIIRVYKNENLWLLLFFVALLPAFSEELFFRGVLVLGALKSKKALLGLFLSTVIFALVHFNWVLLPYYFLIGLYLGVIALKTKSLLVPFVVHFLINFLVVLSICFS